MIINFNQYQNDIYELNLSFVGQEFHRLKFEANLCITCLRLFDRLLNITPSGVSGPKQIV
jgi:hypothetical protein